jgi:hypothetical protein
LQDGQASNQMKPILRRQKRRVQIPRWTSLRPPRQHRNPRPQNSVDADWAVELGAGDDTLEMPWAVDGGGPRYFDLKRQPDLLPQIEEAVRVPELGEFLATINTPASIFETAKCDAWATTEIDFEEEIFGCGFKFASYIDLLFTEERARFSFPEHERLAKQLTDLLRRVPEMPAAAEFIVRRCYFHVEEEIAKGFYITFYLSGFGDDEEPARHRWAIALKVVENAMKQVSLR